MRCEMGWMRWMSGKRYVGGRRSVDLRFMEYDDGMGVDGMRKGI